MGEQTKPVHSVPDVVDHAVKMEYLLWDMVVDWVINPIICACPPLFADLPKDGPHIVGERRIYNPGDLLTLNCSSGKSHPASSLHWFINGVQVSFHIPSKYGLICLWALNKVTLNKWFHVHWPSRTE